MLFSLLCLSCSYLSQVRTDPSMDMPLRVGFIGAGNMAYGIAKGILSGKLKPVGRRKNHCKYKYLHVLTCAYFMTFMYNLRVLYALLLHVEAEV